MKKKTVFLSRVYVFVFSCYQNLLLYYNGIVVEIHLLSVFTAIIWQQNLYIHQLIGNKWNAICVLDSNKN